MTSPTADAMNRSLRGIILRALLELSPQPVLRKALNWILSELQLTHEQLDRQVEWLRANSYITTTQVPILGTTDTKIELTAKGMSSARALNPQEPIL